MTLRPGIEYAPIEMTVLFNSGGFGDAIARLPALRVIERDYPHVTMHVYVTEGLHEVFSKVLSKTKLYPFPPKAEAPDRTGIYFNNKDFYSTMGTHLVTHGFAILVNRTNIPMEDQSYPQLPDLEAERSSFALPERYVVLTPGFTSSVREMLPDVVNGLTTGIRLMGLTPVFLGSKTENIDTSANFHEGINYRAGVDLRNQTTMLQAAAIMQKAVAVAGLDNGLIHLAAMTDVPIVVGYSSQLPENRLPIRDGVLGKGCYVVQPRTCFGCESLIRFQYSHDFRKCYVGDRRCLSEMPAEAYLAHLKTILDSVSDMS